MPRRGAAERFPRTLADASIHRHRHATVSLYSGNSSRAVTVSFERLVNEKMESGLYQTASEVVREALRLLKERDQARDQLRADVQAGFDQFARGEGRSYDAASGRQLAERIKSRGRLGRAEKR